MQTIPFSAITSHQSFKGRNATLDSLIDSIRSIGLIQPIILERRLDDTYHVLAGRRRFAALTLAGHTDLFEGATCDPSRPGFVFQENLTEDQRLEIEHDENVQRLNMKWHEEVLLVYRVHRAKERTAAANFEVWGMRQTGRLVNMSLGSVSNIITIAERLLAGDKEIQQSEGVLDALRILFLRQEDLASKRLAQLAGVSPSPGNLLSDLEVSLSTPATGSIIERDPKAPPRPEHESLTPKGKMTIKLSERLFLGDCVEGPDPILPKWPAECFDHIVTDIPYAIDTENMEDMVNLERVKNEHGVEANVQMMPKFLEQAYRLLKTGGFCVFWYDLDHHEKLQQWAIDVGFRVQRWPLVWVKKHRCKNSAAGFNFTKATEVAMVMRKGLSTLAQPQTVNYIEADGSVERKMYANPFAKPFAVWEFIYKAIAIPGQRVLDPYAGEMSACRAAVICGLQPFAIELKENHYYKGIEQVKSAYNVLCAGNVAFE